MNRFYIILIYAVMSLITAALSASLFSTGQDAWGAIVFLGGVLLTTAVYIDLIESE